MRTAETATVVAIGAAEPRLRSRQHRRTDHYAVRLFALESFLMKSVLALLLLVPLSGCALVPVALMPPASTALVCHKGKKTMELPRDAIGGHLNHGDYRGPCR